MAGGVAQRARATLAVLAFSNASLRNRRDSSRLLCRRARTTERERLLEKVDNLEHRYRALEKRHREETNALEQRLERALRSDAVERAATSDSGQIAALQIRLASVMQRAARAEARVRTLEERLRHSRKLGRRLAWTTPASHEPGEAVASSKASEDAVGPDDATQMSICRFQEFGSLTSAAALVRERKFASFAKPEARL